MSETKQLQVEVKDAAQGLVEAVFATLNVVDSDGDVTLPGAFQDGQEVRISAYGHSSWSGALPVGKGAIREEGDQAIFTGRFFLDTQGGKDTFLTVKELGPLGEWSYGFDVVESELGQHDGQDVRFLKSMDVHEVSPVLLGAGVDTRTLAVKNDKKTYDDSFPDHFDRVLGDVNELVDRAKAWGLGEEAKAGRVVSAANHERLTNIAGAMLEAHGGLLEWLAEHDPNKQRRELAREFLRFQYTLATP